MEMEERGGFCALHQALSGIDMHEPLLDPMLKSAAASWHWGRAIYCS
jgi:hypothetical protein